MKIKKEIKLRVKRSNEEKNISENIDMKIFIR
jgi:hypothetical protein